MREAVAVGQFSDGAEHYQRFGYAENRQDRMHGSPAWIPNALKGSMSWRLTAPLRSLKAMLRGEAAPWNVQSIAECSFYHTMDVPGVGVVWGQWDLRGGVDAYLGGVSLAGKRVLEVGPASGFLTTEMEKRGADVVALEVSDNPGWDFVPFPDAVMAPVYEHRREHLRGIKNSWWFVHAAFKSRAQMIYADAYAMPDMGQFDVALMGAVLLHTRAPLQIVEQCAKRAKTIIITDLLFPDLESCGPVCCLSPTAENKDWGTWWHFSTAFFAQYLRVLGYPDPVVTTHTQQSEGQAIPCFTVTATRASVPGIRVE